MFDSIGGDAHILSLIKIFEKIMNIDELSVRGEALLSFKKILSCAKIEIISNEIVEMIGRSSVNENDSQKLCAIMRY